PQEDDFKFKHFTPKISDAGMEGDNSQQEKYDAIRIKSSTPEGKEATLEIYSGKNISSMIVLYNREDREVNPDDGKVENVLNSQNLPTMSLEEAEDIANHLKNKMGFSDFILADYGATPTGAYSIAETYDDLGKCYVLYYMRTCGLPTNYVSNTLSASTYNFSWPQEVLTFYIDDQGVSEILYDSPTEFTETESEAVKILSFDEIMDIFQKQTIISTFTPPQGDEGIIGHKFDVTKIKLGSARVLVDINSGRYRYVPAWDFYGTWTYIYKEGSQYIQGVDENSEWKEDKFAQSYYTINAIDGSIIDRGVGY
ncbi:MAG: DUF6034 family protein, partial [Christensenella sp.]